MVPLATNGTMVKFPMVPLGGSRTHAKFTSLVRAQNQNQNSLLVIRQIDNFSPGAVTGGGVDIPVPDGLRKETTFICLGYLKCHGMLISATPSLGDKVTCMYSGLTFQIFV